MEENILPFEECQKKEEIINSLIEDSIDLFKKAINENC